MRQIASMALSIALGACGETSLDSGADAGANDASTDPVTVPDAAPDVEADSPNDGAADVDANVDADADAQCPACGPFEYCHDPSGTCSGPGTCTMKPTWCGEPPPVCGCDGVQYASACHASKAGVNVSSDPQGCKPPSADLLTCGTKYCKRGAEFCEISYGDASDVHFSCLPKPAACSVAQCACITTLACSNPTFNAHDCIDDGNEGVLFICTFA